MARARRHSGAVAVALLALTATTPTTRAADPPSGALFDANVTVTAYEAGSTLPIAGATVRLVAAVTDFPEDELQSLTGTTDAAGMVAFSGVARADEGAPPVHLAAMAHRESSGVDARGCRRAMSWDGLVSDLVSSDHLAIAIAATPTSSIACSPRPVLRGIVHDRFGHPIRVRLAQASIVLPSGARRALAIHVAANGSFKLVLPARGPGGGAARVTVRIVGRVSRHVALASGCVRDLGQIGRITRQVTPGDGHLPRLEVVTRESVLGERCGIVGTPRPATVGQVGSPRATRFRRLTWRRASRERTTRPWCHGPPWRSPSWA
ncbi:MAG: hypothetical protein M3067_09185 [Chloroflexota bacterium]|nr:hypothetical protein [Chloroflexota bacterium]